MLACSIGTPSRLPSLPLAVLAAHGATYLTLKTEGPVHDRCAQWAKHLWMAVVPLFFAISLESWNVRPGLAQDAMQRPFCWVGLLLIVAAGCALFSGLTKGLERRAFVGSNLLLIGLLATGSAAFFPVMLYSTLAPENSLTAYSLASGLQVLAARIFLVASGLRAGDDLFRLHLAALFGKSECSAGQPRVLLNAACTDAKGTDSLTRRSRNQSGSTNTEQPLADDRGSEGLYRRVILPSRDREGAVFERRDKVGPANKPLLRPVNIG